MPIALRSSFFAAVMLCVCSAGPLYAQLRILPLGDSITAGYTDNPNWTVPFNHGYRGPLHTLLTEAGYDFEFVGGSPEPATDGTPLLFLPNLNVADWSFGGTRTPVNDLASIGQGGHRGYGGAQSAGLVPLVEGWLAEDEPDIVLLMIGTNDRNLASAQTLIGRVTAARPDAQLIVAQIVPYRSDFTDRNEEVRAFNTGLRDLVIPRFQAAGANVTLVDQYTGFLTDPDDPTSINDALMATGNHPNTAGYNQMAQVWFEGITAVAQVPEPTAAMLLPAAAGVVLARRQPPAGWSSRAPGHAD
ncbi:MAG: GDSL-type esterase/lipase family protein [Planctomycetota bacterium]